MLPTLTSRDIEEGIRSFVKNEFPIATTAFRPNGQSIVEAFADKSENIVKGPWLEIRRPFRKCDAKLPEFLPEFAGELGVLENFEPHRHQARAFERLLYPNPKSTIVATGTGSGKTECFMLPILDAVLRMKKDGIEGIKALVIYPMNALATDQAKRFAELCDAVKKADGPQITVGLYTGAPGFESRTMGEHSSITDRDTLRRNPPDILLTNYKMLDYLLLREEDRPLWEKTSAKSLRYLVVDELHTFDGAQGTDLACLVRRLRDRLDLGEGLACIGTSATLGGGDGMERLQAYASDVFGADFSSTESVITEDRLSTEEYLESFGEPQWAGDWPSTFEAKRLATKATSNSVEIFLADSIRTWLGQIVRLRPGEPADWTETALMLGRMLPHHPAFRRLMSEANGIIHLATMAESWRRDVPAFRELTVEETMLMIRSFVALVSMARLVRSDGALVPFLTVRVQFWVRELANMLATVEAEPKLIPMADVKDEKDGKSLALPIVTCRACNATAWGAVVADGQLVGGARGFYRSWFSRKDPNAKLLYPVVKDEFQKARAERPGELMRLCTKHSSLTWVHDTDADAVYDRLCPVCQTEHDPIIVRVPKIHTSGSNEDGRYVRLQTSCALCGSLNSMRILGARSVTLSSAMTGHLHSSDANDDHKLINFTDSVQDAAHRAGFMEARSYMFALRQAVAGLMRDSEGGKLDFESFLATIGDFWLERTGGKNALKTSPSAVLQEAAEPIAVARFVSTFIPSGMLWRRPWTEFRARIAQYYQEKHRKSKDPTVELENLVERIPALHDDEEKPTPWWYLYQDVAQRLRWEAFVEMTMRVHSGRTVESLGIGTISPDTYCIESAAEKLLRTLSETVGGLRDASIEKFELFVEGFLMHEKLRGAFDMRLPVSAQGRDDFQRFVVSGDQFWFAMSRYLPTYGPNFRPPAPLVLRNPAAQALPYFDAVLPKDARKENWYTLWLTKCFGDDLEVVAAREEIYTTLLAALTDAGALTSLPMSEKAGSIPVYLMTPRSWSVTRALKRAVCPRCGRSHVIDAARADAWSAMPCLSQGCTSTKHDIRDIAPDNATYRGTPLRVTAREHTGNLDHKERGRIERSFIDGREPWDVNLLCATPTLEMGIDIGDLSTVLLSSMPPGPANYVQRIGRAGRRDGNALAMTICDTSLHAQYFWADPEEMLEAEVNPPGVFLHAPAVLERQLFAFAITRWMGAVDEASVPEEIGEVLRKFEAAKDTGYTSAQFPFGLIDYVKENAEGLLADFAGLFVVPGTDRTIFTPEERRRLLGFLIDTSEDTPSVKTRLVGKLKRLVAERTSYEKKRDGYKSTLQRLKKGPIDEHTQRTIEELQLNIDALQTLCRDEFRTKKTLNVLTDEGILPNYAFPEEGIGLDGLVMQIRDRRAPDNSGREAMLAAERASAAEDGNDTLEGLELPDSASEKGEKGEKADKFEAAEKAEKVETKEKAASEPAAKKTRKKKDGVYKRFNFRRAASTGLFELAPGNSYYANEFVLHIDQVDLADDKVAWWRFCPVCNYSAIDRPEETGSACPRCGAPAWQEVGQRRPVLQLRNVYAYADIKSDRISDDREDREHVDLSRVKLVDIDPRVERRSFVLPESNGFGFEYVPSATFRDFNFGKSGTGMTEPFEVASQSLDAPGFAVCKHCGRLRKEVRRNAQGKEYTYGREQHDFSCPVTKDPSKEDWIEGLVLSRSFKSEVLRIRVPQGILTETHTPATVTASLVAALRLGLRRYFHGSVDHLKVMPMVEPAEGGRKRVHYIVVYDTVPGGTGYLKELLANERNMIEVFRTALTALTDCPCGEDGKSDGCYRCVYAHGDASVRRDISRLCAIEVVTDILAKAKDLKKGSIDTTGGVDPTDSELERNFIVALRKAPEVECVKRIPTGSGLFHYLVQMRSGLLWRLELQEDMKGERPSRPDFVFRPLRESERRPDRTMAVFTDGWTYHADIFAEDCAKRQSILNQGMRVWTLYWDDVMARVESDGKDPTAVDLRNLPPLVRAAPPAQIYPQWRAAVKGLTGKEPPEWTTVVKRWLLNVESFGRLLVWLSDPDEAEGCAIATAFAGIFGIQATLGPKVRERAQHATTLLVDAKATEAGDMWLEGPLETPVDTPLRREYRRPTGLNAAILFAEGEALKGILNMRVSSPLEESMRAYWSEAASLQFTNELVLMPTLPETRDETGASVFERLLTASPWAKAFDRLREARERVAHRTLSAAPAEEANASEAPAANPAANPAAEANAAGWASVSDLLPEELLPLAEALEKAGVAIDENDAGVDLVDPARGEVFATAELYWKEAALAVVLEGEDAPIEHRTAGIRCVNGSAPVEEVLALLLAHPGLPKIA